MKNIIFEKHVELPGRMDNTLLLARIKNQIKNEFTI